VNGLIGNLRNLGPARLGAMGAVLVGTIGFFIFLSTRIATPNLSLLYSDLDLRDSAQIVQKLEAMNVPYQIKGDGAQILVPADQVARLRLAMAETGLPHGGSIGYEIFDKSESLGTSSFAQNVNHLRALEGELARTIGSLGAVQNARVHLVLPQRELFSRERQDPSASIVIKMRGAERLTKSQVAAVQHLTASAVPGLRPGRVSIVDAEGNLLARGTEDDKGQANALNLDERQTSYETRLARSIEEMLERSVGPGKVRAEVRADMDFDRVTTNSETYDPDGQVVRSTQSVSETSDSGEGGSDQAVTVANNLPDAQANKGQSTAKSGGKNGRNEETVNYEITKTVKSQIREGGTIKRLSVAVLVDGVSSLAADGTRAYQPRPPEELKQLATLVRSAIGYDEKRGDSVEVVNLRFSTPAETPAAAPDGILGFSKTELLHAGEPLALGLVGLLALLLVVRPLVMRLIEGGGGGSHSLGALAGPDGQQLLTGPSGSVAMAQAALPAPAGMGGMPAVAAAGSPLDSIDQMIDISQVEGRVRASSIKKIGEIVEKHPEEAVAIVRSWMYQSA
jgi:flagellar M-ring protein FliF